MHNDVKKVLISKEELSEKVNFLGKCISEDYKDKNLLMIGVLKGSFIFMADIIRAVSVPCQIDFMAVSSYGDGVKSSGVVKIIKDLTVKVEGCDVLLVEDILDTGLTLSYLMEFIRQRNPESIKICTLLDKPERRKSKVMPDYSGFSIPDEFVIGYGLDYNERYRNLPYIGVLKESVYS